MLYYAVHVDTIYRWIMWTGLLMSMNHFRTGSTIKCHGRCWESTDAPSTQRYTSALLSGAPECKGSDPTTSVDCNPPRYDGCMKQLFKVTKPKTMEFTLYDCDRSESPVGCTESPDDRQTFNATIVNYKCKSDLCNTVGTKSCEKNSGQVYRMAASVLWSILAVSWLLRGQDW